MNASIYSALIVMGGLGLLFGVGLALASRIFFVEKDPRVEEIEEILPNVNCGACGAPGCAGFAEGVVKGKYSVSGCTVGGIKLAAEVTKIMGAEEEEFIAEVAVVRCRGDKEKCAERAIYQGVMDCKAATLVDNGAKGCVYGCLGLGTCVLSCPFNAIAMNKKNLPVVNEDLCVGCGKCVEACPRGIMELIPWDQKVFMGCVSRDFGKAVKSVCKVGCIGCSLCANPKTTSDEIIVMDSNLPVIQYDKVKEPWIDLAKAVDKCPTDSFGIRGKRPPMPKEEKEEKEEAAV
jgi:electron transport complex protein RnfB